MSVRENFSYLTRHVNLDCLVSRDLLRRLVDVDILKSEDYEFLLLRSSSPDDRADRLFLHILPRQPLETFTTFCRILRDVGLHHVARHLTEGPQNDSDGTANTPA